MARFDRYMLSQLLVLFGFFALILISIYWINSAVRLFDRLIADGQTALVSESLKQCTAYVVRDAHGDTLWKVLEDFLFAYL